MRKFNAEAIQVIALMLVCVIGGAVLYSFSRHNTDELDYPEIRARLPLDNADTIKITCAGSCVVDDEAIVWYIAGEEGEYYIPLECSVINYNEYQLIDYCEALDTNIQDISYVEWKNGYAVIINNKNCTGFEARNEDGSFYTTELDEASIPYVMYVDDISSCSFMMLE